MYKKLLLKGLLWFFGIVVGLFLLVAFAFNVSPKPGVWIIRHMFNSEVQITAPEYYQKAQEKITKVQDKRFASRFKDNSYDIYYPKQNQETLPVLIWVHGGGFVGGDKKGTQEFATRLAADAHIAVLSMNYETAPESAYPNQVMQLSELIQSLKKEKFKFLDLSKIMLGGDSAGSQIALQYAATQTNASYGKSVGVPQDLDKNVLKGAISYCGPVNLTQMTNVRSSSQFMKFFVTTVAWAEIGTKNWQDSPKLDEISIVNHLTSDFPATYITDGNAYSFQDQGIGFEKKLKELNVPVRGLFYKDLEKEITHEYQFDYSLKESQECYRQTLEFVREHKDK
uniref:alpha/beta hydrolase n=1 Tax=Lactococcus petauri TaxID=1940789 RepID=UPI00254BD5CA|nr:alpha/beta hydrolase [Lactococcus petauri]